MIVVECKPDKLLVKMLIPGVKVVHSGGKGNAAKILEKNENIIAMLDEDPESPQPRYLRELKEVERKHGIKILIDEKRKNKVILLTPRLEEWIISVAKRNGVRLEKYYLPETGKELHAIINHNLSAFSNLILRLMDSEELTFLKESLKV
ncbi:hypothetical protein [Pyrococcus abyssi]|uniref:Uncharacterized protein n=1 Tax=Pyrococcus abyssi (strain GE5 / Orsay) TaxID=272844 RepID=Q9V0J4_PYRAB|nr:hypothetical protein [Pyrococcus abyssi]CAB49709.1 Hypothetical protein PAB0540 [Pyrococcus abyssi GE5]CCE70195.1 TPA: hypothetical protein PAB0540 [Pyrococcus abyssi GE5]